MSSPGNRGKDDWVRCQGCRTRRRTGALLFSHLLAHPECRPCKCSGWWFPHRRGTTCCEANPDAPVQQAARAGEDDIEMLRALAGRFRSAADQECPF